MIKLMFCLRKRADLSHEEFYRYWKEQHGQLVLRGIQGTPTKRYVQLYTLQHPINDALREPRNTLPAYDGIAEGTWESLEELIATFGTPDGELLSKMLIEDELNFIDLEQSCVFILEEHVMLDSTME